MQHNDPVMGFLSAQKIADGTEAGGTTADVQGAKSRIEGDPLGPQRLAKRLAIETKRVFIQEETNLVISGK